MAPPPRGTAPGGWAPPRAGRAAAPDAGVDRCGGSAPAANPLSRAARRREAGAARRRGGRGLAGPQDDIVGSVGGAPALFVAFGPLLAPGAEVLVLAPPWMPTPKRVGFVDGAPIPPHPAYLELMSG